MPYSLLSLALILSLMVYNGLSVLAVFRFGAAPETTQFTHAIIVAGALLEIDLPFEGLAFIQPGLDDAQ